MPPAGSATATKEKDKTPVKAADNTPAAPAAPVQDQSEKAVASLNFIQKVEKQFTSELGSGINWSPLEKTLAQHLFTKIDGQLRDLEVKRASNSYKKDDPPIIWKNVNMYDLALASVRIVSLELDALQPNHVHVVPYLNKRTGQYDVNLQIGYEGVHHIRMKFSLDPIRAIRYELVHEGDEFDIDLNDEGGELPIFKRANYFQPGKVIGGFTHVKYVDSSKDRVFPCEEREFEKAKKASGNTAFWGGDQEEWQTIDGKRQKVNVGYDEKFEKEMQLKTVVIRGCKKIPVDPARVNEIAAIESGIDSTESAIDAEARDLGNVEPLSLEQNNGQPVPGAEQTGEVAMSEQERATAEASAQAQQAQTSLVDDETDEATEEQTQQATEGAPKRGF